MKQRLMSPRQRTRGRDSAKIRSATPLNFKMRVREILTSLGDDGSGGDDDNGPVELALEVGDDLVADLVEGGGGSVGDLDEEDLAS